MIAPAEHGGRCFGTDWRSDLDLSLFDRAMPVIDPAAISVRLMPTLHDRRLHRISPRVERAADGFRLRWQDEATFDAYADGRVEVVPDEQWCGTLPIAFYSTVAAMLLAWRGLLPMHMSSVVIDGRAWLIGGAGGSGKSSLAAELVAGGAQFLADDLTVLHSHAGQLLAARGRPSMRLYPAMAARIDHEQGRGTTEDDRGKRLIWPRHRAADARFPIGGIVILRNDQPDAISGPDKLRLLAESLFRPRIVRQLPAIATIHQHLLGLAQVQNVAVFPHASGQGLTDAAVRMRRLFAIGEG